MNIIKQLAILAQSSRRVGFVSKSKLEVLRLRLGEPLGEQEAFRSPASSTHYARSE